MSTPILEARSLFKTYRMGKVSVPVLRGASVRIEPGECVAILGASGSGKSTLLHLLGGLDRPNRFAPGRCISCLSAIGAATECPQCGIAATQPADRDSANCVLYQGVNLSGLSTSELDGYRNRSVGFVFQLYHLLPELNVLENTLITSMVGLGRLGFARRRAELSARAESLLKRFGLGHRLRHRPVELSGGERQRVAIARALMNQPRLLLADEPTGNLDAKTGASILDAILSLREEDGLTIVMVTHDANTAARAGRIVQLYEGREVESAGDARRDGVDGAMARAH